MSRLKSMELQLKVIVHNRTYKSSHSKAVSQYHPKFQLFSTSIFMAFRISIYLNLDSNQIHTMMSIYIQPHINVPTCYPMPVPTVYPHATNACTHSVPTCYPMPVPTVYPHATQCLYPQCTHMLPNACTHSVPTRYLMPVPTVYPHATQCLYPQCTHMLPNACTHSVPTCYPMPVPTVYPHA